MKAMRAIVGVIGGAVAGGLVGGLVGGAIFLYLLGTEDEAYPLVLWVPVGIGAVAWAIYAGWMNARDDSEFSGGGPYHVPGTVEWELDQIRQNTQRPPTYRD